ncbi:hypothetical protein J6I39_06380 [bacterium]|nr:hypothetical protein [bacterium]
MTDFYTFIHCWAESPTYEITKSPTYKIVENQTGFYNIKPHPKLYKLTNSFTTSSSPEIRRGMG